MSSRPSRLGPPAFEIGFRFSERFRHGATEAHRSKGVSSNEMAGINGCGPFFNLRERPCLCKIAKIENSSDRNFYCNGTGEGGSSMIVPLSQLFESADRTRIYFVILDQQICLPLRGPSAPSGTRPSSEPGQAKGR